MAGFRFAPYGRTDGRPVRPHRPWQLNDGSRGSSVGVTPRFTDFSAALKPSLGDAMKPILADVVQPPVIQTPLATAGESGAGRFAGIKQGLNLPNDTMPQAPMLASVNDAEAPMQPASRNGWVSTTPQQVAEIGQRYATRPTQQRYAFGGPTRNLPY